MKMFLVDRMMAMINVTTLYMLDYFIIIIIII